MVEALQHLGHPNLKYTKYPYYRFRDPYLTHDSWTETYNNPNLYKWFLKFRKDGDAEDAEYLPFLHKKIDSLNISDMVRVQFAVKYKAKRNEEVVLLGGPEVVGLGDPNKRVKMYKNE